MQKTNNLQEIFLTQVRRERRNVTAFFDERLSDAGLCHRL